jgi:hypothetical protein
LTGYAVSSGHKPVRALGGAYRRNGTADLFVALEVATGQMHSKTTEPSQKTKKGFPEFMDELLSELNRGNNR